jgi:hypothetical protein
MATHDVNPVSYTAILEAIREWPVEERLALMHDILRTLAPSDGAPIRKNTWAQASGLLAGPWPPPSDEDVERMLDESRAEKYD